MALQPYQPLDINAMIMGGARLAQSQREAEAFKLKKEDRAWAREDAQKKLDFEQSVRDAVAAVPPNGTPEERMLAIRKVAALDPKTADMLMGVDQGGTKLEADQFALQNKQALDAAHVWKPIIEGIDASPDPATFEMAFRSLQSAQAQGAQVEPKMLAQLLDPQRRQELLATTNDTIARLGPKPKAEPAYKIDQPVAELAGAILATKTGKPQLADPRIGITDPGWPAAFAEARVEKEKLARAGATTIKNDIGPKEPGTTEVAGAARNALMDKLDFTNGYLEKTAQIKKTIAPAYFGAEGAVKGFLTHAVGYFAPEMMPEKWNDWVDAKRELSTFSTMSAYDIMVALSGKAITEPERKLLLSAAGNLDKMTMKEYQGAVEAMEKVMLFQKSRLEKALTPGGGQNVVDDPAIQSWMDSQVDVVTREQEKGAISDEIAAKRLLKIQNDGLYRLMGVRARRRLGAGPVRPDPETSPASATMKTPAASKGVPITRDGVTKYWNGKEWVE